MGTRVALVTEYCPPYRTGIFERFAGRFDAHIFFCATKDSWEAFGDFPHTVVPHRQLRPRYHVAPGLFHKLWSYDPDVVIGGPVEGFGGQAAYLYSKLTRTPFVLWTGSWHLPLTTLRTVTFPLIRRIYLGSDAIAVYGPHIEDYLADLGVDRSKVSVAWNSVDIARFAESDESAEAEVRTRHGIPEDALLVMYVGRLVKEKGLEYLLEAFGDARPKIEEETHLLIVGDGDRREHLEAIAQDVENATLAGYVDNTELAPYYGTADVFVLPSITTAEFREPWGLVVNEAMSAGTAIIATGSVGAAAGGLVRDGENGYVVPERNAQALANRLVDVLNGDSEAMGSRSRELIEEVTFDEMVRGFESAIHTALDVDS